MFEARIPGLHTITRSYQSAFQKGTSKDYRDKSDLHTFQERCFANTTNLNLVAKCEKPYIDGQVLSLPFQMTTLPLLLTPAPF